MPAFLAIIFCLIFGLCASPSASAQGTKLIPSGLIHIVPNSNFYSPYAFVVDKSQRRLTVWQSTTAGLTKVVDYDADVGRKEGEKKMRDDHRTPVGTYFLQEMLEGAGLDFKLYGKRAFTLNYPNFFDVRDGKTGSGIWLHAVPDDVPLTRGSRGCVVVRNDSILALSQYVSLGKTPILIYEKAEMEQETSINMASRKILQTLEAWRTSWQQKRMDDYIQFYSDEFRSQRMNRAAWKEFKTSLAQQYANIEVKLSEPIVYRHNDRWVARFVQQYTSDQHGDIGEKTLFLREQNGKLLILSEEWAANTSAQARQEVQQSSWAAKYSQAAAALSN